MIPEFQVVILAAGGGSRMYPLTEEIPKALLPVGNLPLIWYPINNLHKHGFDEFIIVVLRSKENMFSQALKPCCDKKIKFNFVTIPDDEDLGTAESLKFIKDKIETDTIIVSCDLITDVPFHRLADVHRTHDATLSVLMAPRVEVQQEKEANKGGKIKTKDNEQGQKDFISIDRQEDRLLFMLNEADLDVDSISIKKSLLKRYPSMMIQNDLVDSHMYIMKKWLIDFIAENRSFESLKADAIPYVINKQFSKAKQKEQQNDLNSSMASLTECNTKPDIFSFAREDDVRSSVRLWSVHGDSGNSSECSGVIRCHGYVADDNLTVRINDLPAYTHINREITKLLPTILQNQDFAKIHSTVHVKEKSQIGSDCIVGESVSISENVSIKKSTIGKHCKIGSKVKISNSVVMEYVTIEDGCSIQGSVICNYAYIKENSNLKDCQVGANINVRGDHNKELLVNEVMDLDD
ncbi:translation initiation factor eIF2B subunit gamma-like isoform X1 [Rhopilema esculentum]|uniref:translation initiation factor eIF2B subunit gamma-like isoform X1 n=2 Tax=Rhopilema esculentum TaxID=499914 RepID=UPI0031E2EE06